MAAFQQYRYNSVGGDFDENIYETGNPIPCVPDVHRNNEFRLPVSSLSTCQQTWAKQQYLIQRIVGTQL